MGTLNLDKIFNPESIALIGASDREGSVGYFLMKNLSEAGYKGRVYPVNLHKTEILGFKAYQTVDQLPETVDLAVIAVARAVEIFRDVAVGLPPLNQTLARKIMEETKVYQRAHV